MSDYKIKIINCLLFTETLGESNEIKLNNEYENQRDNDSQELRISASAILVNEQDNDNQEPLTLATGILSNEYDNKEPQCSTSGMSRFSCFENLLKFLVNFFRGICSTARRNTF